VTDGPLHFTMRELQRLVFAPRFWAAIAGASILLGLVGPFGTYEGLRLPARLAYWAATVVATYLVGSATVDLLVRLIWSGRSSGTFAYAAAGAIAGVPVAAVVWGINFAVFEGDAIPFLPLTAYCIAISAVVSGLVALFTEQFERTKARAEAASAGAVQKRPRILDRLPPHLRGELSHLTVQDHYVDVRTDKGGTLVLMRLADAIAETEGVEGLQIHRSHWIALNQVAQSVRLGGRLMLKMKDGTMLPVSRTYLEDARAAGLG
jgi:DNA-binding LytR/AlgR family response regulator